MLNKLNQTFSPSTLFTKPPTLLFRYEHNHCPHCNAELQVLKTYTRKPRTLHIGEFVARETVLYCPQCPERPSFHSEELAALVGPDRTFGHDVMVYAGEAMLRRCRTSDETVADLAEYNLGISASEVRDLTARFVISLGLAHAEATPRLDKHMRTSGGYVLHIDSTCKGGSSHLLTGIDEISGFVLLNAKVLSESEARISAFLRDLFKRFGPPHAVSCDMSPGILSAVAATLPDTPVFICHFHFLRDLGKDLIANDYNIIRKRLRYHGLKAKLKRMQQELMDVVHENSEAIEGLLHCIGNGTAHPETLNEIPYSALLGGFITSILDAQREGDGCGFPFDRPHLLFFRQAQSVLSAAESLCDYAPMSALDQELYRKLIAALEPTCSDCKLIRAADALEGKAKLFDRLRSAMRIAQPNAGKGLNDNGDNVSVGTIEANVNSFCDELRQNEKLMSRSEYRSLLAQIDKYRDKLFADPIQVQTPQGDRLIQPQRTNNILERFFRHFNHQGCRRTGQQPTAKFIDNILSDTPLVANLDNPDYVTVLLNGCEDLAQRLARVDQDLVDATLAELRKPQTGLKSKTRSALRSPPAVLKIAMFILQNAA